jgi:hypothetical protein
VTTAGTQIGNKIVDLYIIKEGKSIYFSLIVGVRLEVSDALGMA